MWFALFVSVLVNKIGQLRLGSNEKKRGNKQVLEKKRKTEKEKKTVEKPTVEAGGQVAPTKSKSETGSDYNSCPLSRLKSMGAKHKKGVESPNSETTISVAPVQYTKKHRTKRMKRLKTTDDQQGIHRAQRVLAGLTIEASEASIAGDADNTNTFQLIVYSTETPQISVLEFSTQDEQEHVATKKLAQQDERIEEIIRTAENLQEVEQVVVSLDSRVKSMDSQMQSMNSQVQSLDKRLASLDSKLEDSLNNQTRLKHDFSIYKHSFYENMDTIASNILETNLVRQLAAQQYQFTNDLDFVKLQLVELVNHLKEIGDAKKEEGGQHRNFEGGQGQSKSGEGPSSTQGKGPNYRRGETLSVIPRGSLGDVARRFTMIRWTLYHDPMGKFENVFSETDVMRPRQVVSLNHWGSHKYWFLNSRVLTVPGVKNLNFRCAPGARSGSAAVPTVVSELWLGSVDTPFCLNCIKNLAFKKKYFGPHAAVHTAACHRAHVAHAAHSCRVHIAVRIVGVGAPCTLRWASRACRARPARTSRWALRALLVRICARWPQPVRAHAANPTHASRLRVRTGMRTACSTRAAAMSGR
ncbi:hypothetical protein F511_20369 [Dorcoceras hygrometricum]|uniref:Uncharacterized protein n=1 Tax=Dorcoceras hygrometricum TaxID=472368 RepID=A0A2Z7BDF0_9LAMI|nr:hypothetical protein F511_20369 [Dorcoceras hygrometricum]